MLYEPGVCAHSIEKDIELNLQTDMGDDLLATLLIIPSILMLTSLGTIPSDEEESDNRHILPPDIQTHNIYLVKNLRVNLLAAGVNDNRVNHVTKVNHIFFRYGTMK
jgi:hypothetical protein